MKMTLRRVPPACKATSLAPSSSSTHRQSSLPLFEKAVLSSPTRFKGEPLQLPNTPLTGHRVTYPSLPRSRAFCPQVSRFPPPLTTPGPCPLSSLPPKTPSFTLKSRGHLRLKEQPWMYTVGNGPAALGEGLGTCEQGIPSRVLNLKAVWKEGPG